MPRLAAVIALTVVSGLCLFPGCGPGTVDDYSTRCPSGSVGSELGESITSGWLGARENNLSGSCGGENSPDFAWTWTAPKTGTYVFTTEESDAAAVIYLLEGTTCNGDELACGDQSGYAEVSRHFEADESVVVVVDGDNSSDQGVRLTIRRSFDDATQ